MPLIAEVLIATGVAYFVGVVVAYLVEFRRRSGRERRW
jgi:hypothetical protein